LREQKGSLEDKLKILEMMKKLEEQDKEEETCDTEDLEERFQDIDINSDPEEVWSALTEDERKDFESAVKSGEISNVIDVWVPWWSLKGGIKNRKKIEDLSKENAATEEIQPSNNEKPQTVEQNRDHNIPPVKRNIPPLSSIMKSSTPNPNVQFSCIDVLFSYAYIMRLYNGCPEDSLDQAAEDLLQLSPVLSQNSVFESVESVVHNSLSVLQHSKDLCCSEELSHLVILDVISLIRGHKVNEEQRTNFVEHAMSHLCRLLSRGREKLKLNSKLNQQEEHLCKSLWLAKKKAEFLLAWVHSNTVILESLALDIQVIHAEVSMSYKQHKEQTENLEQAWGGSKPPKKASLITEM